MGELLFQHRSLFSPPPEGRVIRRRSQRLALPLHVAGATAACAARPRLTERGAFSWGRLRERAGLSGDDLKPESERIRFHTEALLRVAGGPHLNIGSRLASPAISESRRGGGSVTVPSAAGPLLP